MLRDNLVELIEPMLNSAGADPLALYIHTRTPASDDRLQCLKNPRPEGAESSLTESASSPFQAEPAQELPAGSWKEPSALPGLRYKGPGGDRPPSIGHGWRVSTTDLDSCMQRRGQTRSPARSLRNVPSGCGARYIPTVWPAIAGLARHPDPESSDCS